VCVCTDEEENSTVIIYELWRVKREKFTIIELMQSGKSGLRAVVRD